MSKKDAVKKFKQAKAKMQKVQTELKQLKSENQSNNQ